MSGPNIWACHIRKFIFHQWFKCASISSQDIAISSTALPTYPSNTHLVSLAPAPVDSGSIHHSWSPMWLLRAPRRCYPLDRYLCAQKQSWVSFVSLVFSPLKRMLTLINKISTRFHWRSPFFLFLILSSSLFRVYAGITAPISGFRSPQKGQ